LALVPSNLACHIAYVTLGKVFSPQYRVRLIPLAGMAAPFSLLNARKLLPAAFVVQIEYPFLYGLLYLTLVPTAGALNLVRTTWGVALRGRDARRPAQPRRLKGSTSGALRGASA
jgi:hypothetical protein